MAPTEPQKEAFRVAYKMYQDTSQALAVAQEGLLEATKASSAILRSARVGGHERAIDEWDASKARRSADAIEQLSLHYDLVAKALHCQATSLREVTDIATALIQESKQEQHAP